MKGLAFRFSLMAFSGQAAAQRPHPMHLDKSTAGLWVFFSIVQALVGQILMHSGQVPLHNSIFISEWKLDLSESPCRPPKKDFNAVQQHVQQLQITNGWAFALA